MLKNIFCKIMSDEQQRQKMNSLEDKNQIYKLFCQNGYTKSYDEFEKEMEVFLNSEDSKKLLNNDSGELSDEMLEMIAGGVNVKRAVTSSIAMLLTTFTVGAIGGQILSQPNFDTTSSPTQIVTTFDSNSKDSEQYKDDNGGGSNEQTSNQKLNNIAKKARFRFDQKTGLNGGGSSGPSNYNIQYANENDENIDNNELDDILNQIDRLEQEQQEQQEQKQQEQKQQEQEQQEQKQQEQEQQEQKQQEQKQQEQKQQEQKQQEQKQQEQQEQKQQEIDKMKRNNSEYWEKVQKIQQDRKTISDCEKQKNNIENLFNKINNLSNTSQIQQLKSQVKAFLKQDTSNLSLEQANNYLKSADALTHQMNNVINTNNK